MTFHIQNTTGKIKRQWETVLTHLVGYHFKVDGEGRSLGKPVFSSSACGRANGTNTLRVICQCLWKLHKVFMPFGPAIPFLPIFFRVTFFNVYSRAQIRCLLAAMYINYRLKTVEMSSSRAPGKWAMAHQYCGIPQVVKIVRWIYTDRHAKDFKAYSKKKKVYCDTFCTEQKVSQYNHL